MKRRLSANGNSWHLYLNKPLAQFLGITKDEYTVLLKIKNKVLYVTKVANADIQSYENRLCKKLIRRSSGYGLNIPAPLLEMLEIDPEIDEIEFNIEDDVLTIKKAS